MTATLPAPSVVSTLCPDDGYTRYKSVARVRLHRDRLVAGPHAGLHQSIDIGAPAHRDVVLFGRPSSRPPLS